MQVACELPCSVSNVVLGFAFADSRWRLSPPGRYISFLVGAKYFACDVGACFGGCLERGREFGNICKINDLQMFTILLDAWLGVCLFTRQPERAAPGGKGGDVPGNGQEKRSMAYKSGVTSKKSERRA